jgi:peptidoglycan/LPS O-acetylase OafA/YrhL
MNAAVEPKANLPALTGIRGIAAWFVVLYHIRGSMAWQVPAELTSVLAKGYLSFRGRSFRSTSSSFRIGASRTRSAGTIRPGR